MHVCEGDRVSIEIVDDHRYRKSLARPLSNFKNPSSQIVGGYIVSGGEGHTITFTIRFTSSTTASASARLLLLLVLMLATMKRLSGASRVQRSAKFKKRPSETKG